MFQSLSGFQVRCNLSVSVFSHSHEQRFNPYRVFKFAATDLLLLGFCQSHASFNPYRVFKFAATDWYCCWPNIPALWFQSLSGFQVRCNTLEHLLLFPQALSFNPYRVFKFAATQIFSGNSSEYNGFNPYRVFKFAATQKC